MANELAAEEDVIAQRILVIRGQRVLLDSDLAAMYGVATKRFNEQVRRNVARFPADFSFVLEEHDFANLRSQFATSKPSAFVKMRQTLASNAAMNARLHALERSMLALDKETRKQFEQVYEAILGLMNSTSSRN